MAQRIDVCETATDVRQKAKQALDRRRLFYRVPQISRPAPPPPRIATFDELVAAAYPARYPDEIYVMSVMPTVKQIQRAVCREFNVDLEDMLSPRRYSTIVLARQTAMALSKKLTKRSFPDMGRQFGGKDHTTVLHAWRKLEPAVKAAVGEVGDNVTLTDLVRVTARYAKTMHLEIPYKKARPQPWAPFFEAAE